MIYFILFAILLACIYVYDYRRHVAGRTASFILICIFFIAVAGLRYRIGGDSIGYEMSYRSIPALGELSGFKFGSTRWEPGYLVLNSLAKTFSSDFTVFQFIHAIIVNSVIFWFVFTNTRNIFIAITIYFFAGYLNFNTEVLRESLAVSCFLLAWPSFKAGRWYIYYPLVLLACCFHISAFSTLILPLFLLPGIRGLFRLGYRTIFICLIIFVVALFIQRRFFTIVELLSQNDTLTDRAQTYAKSTWGGMRLNVLGMMEQVIKMMLIPAAALWYMKMKYKFQDDIGKIKTLRRMEVMIVTGIYYSTVTMVIFIFQRFNNYLLMFDYVIIASCFFNSLRISYKKKIRLPGIYWVCILVVILTLNLKLYFTGTYGSATNKVYMLYYPYSSRLDPQDDPDREEVLRFGSHIR